MDAAVWVTGNVGSEVELKEFREGATFASFRLACTPRVWRGGQWGDDETTWLGVVCSRGLALNVKSSIGKGDPVIVVGRLRTERWKGDDGVAHERLKLEAQSVGHDLSRGTSVFRKATKTTSEDHGVSLGELMLSTEEQSDPVPDAATDPASA
jgi:single-strand DNA-binding protein